MCWGLNRPWESKSSCGSVTSTALFFSVRGNHEQMLIDQLNSERVILRDREHLSPQETHIKSDGQWFVDLPQTQKLWYYRKLKSLPYFIEIECYSGRVGICHAGVPEGITDWQSLKAQSAPRHMREQILRNRSAKKQQQPISGIGVTVHGHTGFKEVTQVYNSFWIDTYKKSGKMTVLEVNSLFAQAR